MKIDLHELLEVEEVGQVKSKSPVKASVKTVIAEQIPQAIDLTIYDRYCVAFSGGKDSLATVLYLLDLGVHPSKIELHHHLVDGMESTLMDWPCTEDYCRKFAQHFGMKIYMSWKVGGFEREMLRNGTKTAPVAFESEDGTVKVLGGDGGKEGVRMVFPQTSADLNVRWCSSYQKISVMERLLNHEPRFREGKTLVITGERAEESSSRANYKDFEPDRSDLRNGKKVQRYIDHWRSVHKWSEAKVWEIIQRYKVNPHPAYWLGFGRTSCRNCIFNGPDTWATIKVHMPHAFIPIRNYEKQFGVTIHRTKTVDEQADSGTPFPCTLEMLELAESKVYYAPIIVEDWKLPPGAFKHTGGPT